MTSSTPVNLQRVGDVTIISFGATPVSITEPVVMEISEPLLQATEVDRPRILVDLNAVEFFSSAFIELLFRVWNRVKTSDGGRFGLSNLHPYCKEVLDVTNLTSVWRIFETREEAIAEMTADEAAWSASS